MQIPTRLKIKDRWYTVEWCDGFESTLIVGRCRPGDQLIQMSRTWNGKPTSPALTWQKFWHEVFHAMLFEMGNRQWRNCTLVEQMSRNLVGVFNTVEFDDGAV